MHLIKQAVSLSDLKIMAQSGFGNLVKAVVDIDREIMAVDASLHSDEEAYLLTKGSSQKNLWGINLYPDLEGDDFIEFDSLINLRPNQGNMSRGVDDPMIRSSIITIVNKLITK